MSAAAALGWPVDLAGNAEQTGYRSRGLIYLADARFIGYAISIK